MLATEFLSVITVLRGNAFLSVLAGLVVFLIGHLLGRLLKKRTGVRIGFIYQIFAAAMGALASIYLFGAPLILTRHLLSLAQLTGAFVLAAMLNRYFWELYFIRSGKPAAPKFFSQVSSLIVVLAAFLLIITVNYHQSGVISTVLTTGGVLALTIGLALQDLLGNMIAGFTIHFGQPFKLGDWLILDDKHVEVMEINWRSTRCRTNDDTYLDVPNTLIVKQTVMNLYYPERVHAIRVQVGLDYATPPNLAKECLMRAALGCDDVLRKPEPYIYLTNFGESTVDYEVKVFISNHARYPKITDEIRTNIWYELKRRNLDIPFPQRVVELHRAKPKVANDFPPKIRDVLKKKDTFSFLTREQLNHLTENCHGVVFGRGERIIQQGDPGESMFVIISGSVRVLVDASGTSTEVAHLKAGDCFGEMSLMTGENRSATIVAAEDTLVGELPKENMSRLLKENERMLEKLSQLLAERKLATEGHLAETMERGQRLALTRSLKATFLGRLRTFFEL